LSSKPRRIFDVAFTVLARHLEVTHIISNSVGYTPQNARVFGRFIVRADEILSAFVELEREVLTVTFYLESIQADS
jgi:hypothetical protein